MAADWPPFCAARTIPGLPAQRKNGLMRLTAGAVDRILHDIEPRGFHDLSIARRAVVTPDHRLAMKVFCAFPVAHAHRNEQHPADWQEGREPRLQILMVRSRRVEDRVERNDAIDGELTVAQFEHVSNLERGVRSILFG